MDLNEGEQQAVDAWRSAGELAGEAAAAGFIAALTTADEWPVVDIPNDEATKLLEAWGYDPARVAGDSFHAHMRGDRVLWYEWTNVRFPSDDEPIDG